MEVSRSATSDGTLDGSALKLTENRIFKKIDFLSFKNWSPYNEASDIRKCTGMIQLKWIQWIASLKRIRENNLLFKNRLIEHHCGISADSSLEQ